MFFFIQAKAIAVTHMDMKDRGMLFLYYFLKKIKCACLPVIIHPNAFDL